MFERVILGVDPGTRAMGLAVVASNGSAKPSVLWSSTIRTGSDEAASERLRRLAASVRGAIAEHRPETLAIERLMWGRNTGSAMEVARASGAILVTAAECGVPVEEYVPLEVKMAVTGVGNASKEQVRKGIGLLIGAEQVPSDADAADAVAVALCHLSQSRLRRLAKQTR